MRSPHGHDADHEFRGELTRWLAENSPETRDAGTQDEEFETRRSWQRRLAADNWAAVAWPRRYGGREATSTQTAIFFQQITQAGAPLPANVLGLLLAGPTILRWGTNEQKNRFLPPIVTAEEIWCQGFSEPGSGSDLASLTTKAVKTDGGWTITGQKVWTSYARYADRCMLLARTGREPRHGGLTYFMMDMRQPGVRVQPLRDITGAAHFNEVFIDEAVVADEHVLGGEGNGWRTAMTTLASERSGLSLFHQVRMRQLLDRLVRQVVEDGRWDDVRVRDSIADLVSEVETLRLTVHRGLDTLERTGQPGPENSVTKLMWAQANQHLTQVAMDVLDTDVLLEDRGWSYEMLRSKGNSIEGGTSEILKNIIAERVLGLPRLPRRA